MVDLKISPATCDGAPIVLIYGAEGRAPILVPNQGAVMLWQTVRSAAIGLSAAMVQSFRRLKARKQHPMTADVDAEIQTSFKSDVVAVTLPKKAATPKPEKKIQVQAAA